MILTWIKSDENKLKIEGSFRKMDKIFALVSPLIVKEQKMFLKRTSASPKLRHFSATLPLLPILGIQKSWERNLSNENIM